MNITRPTQQLHLVPGATLFRQGERPRFIYLVRGGILKLVRGSAQGRQIITELLFPGDACDLLTVSGEQFYDVSARALRKASVEVDCIPREAFGTWGGTESLWGGWHQRLKFQREMMVSIAVERVEERALRVLAMLAVRLGVQPNVNLLGMVSQLLTRQEFSELIGSTMESAIRTLGDLKRGSSLS